MPPARERIGILGGTFDPVHVGHLMDAAAARHQLGLDRVLVVVAGDPWQKHDRVIAPAEVRYEMVAAALDGVAGLEASRIELERDGPTYTIDTVEQLAAPGRELFLVRRQRRRGGLAVVAPRRRAARARDARDRRPGADAVPGAGGLAGRRASRCRAWSSRRPTCAARVAAGEPIDFLVPTAGRRICARTASTEARESGATAIAGDYHESRRSRSRARSIGAGTGACRSAC